MGSAQARAVDQQVVTIGWQPRQNFAADVAAVVDNDRLPKRSVSPGEISREVKSLLPPVVEVMMRMGFIG